MEIFYPANRFINFYIVPLVIESRDSTAEVAESVGHAIILRDITETRRTEQQTIESERLNALTLLAAGVAHEIGNPLNSLNIHLQLIERQARKLDGAEPGVSLGYWPLRQPGDQVTVTHSNRDYLGVITGSGPGRTTVERSIRAARAACRWDIGS